MAKAKIYYHDIGDYLSREEKLALIKKNRTIANMQWQTLTPNEHGDWLNLRNDAFGSFIPLEPEKKYDVKAKSFFLCVSGSVVSSRDAWCYNFSNPKLKENIQKTIEYYNEQRELIEIGKQEEPQVISTKGSWSRDWQIFLRRKKKIKEENEYRISQYRPFVKCCTYFADDLNQERYQLPKFFPQANSKNLLICVTGKSLFSFSVLITDHISEFGFLNGRNGTTQCFPLYYYEEDKSKLYNLFDAGTDNKYIRRDAISNFILERAKKQYGNNVTKEDIFYYVYGFLHSPQYRETFASDLKKMLPRLPLVENVRDFWAFSKAGRKLAGLHLNYELQITNYELLDGVIDYLQPEKFDYEYSMAAESPIKYFTQKDFDLYRVEKMRFPSKADKSQIIYNSRITIKNIPEAAYEYVVNGKSAIEWIMERYQITTHKESGITNNPNDWSAENKNPRYILDLLLNVINLSIKTMEIVKGLPEVKFEE